MKKLQRGAALLLAIALLFGALPMALAAKSYTGTINTDDVFFRMKPNTDCLTHCRFKKNTKITVTGVSGNFYAVTYDKKTGYVMKKYVTLSAADQKALNASVSTSKYASITSISKLGDAPAATKFGSSGDAVESRR